MSLFVSKAKTNANCQQPQSKSTPKKGSGFKGVFSLEFETVPWESNCGAGRGEERLKEGRVEGAALRVGNSFTDGEKVFELQ